MHTYSPWAVTAAVVLILSVAHLEVLLYHTEILLTKIVQVREQARHDKDCNENKNLRRVQSSNPHPEFRVQIDRYYER